MKKQKRVIVKLDSMANFKKCEKLLSQGYRVFLNTFDSVILIK